MSPDGKWLRDGEERQEHLFSMSCESDTCALAGDPGDTMQTLPVNFVNLSCI